MIPVMANDFVIAVLCPTRPVWALFLKQPVLRRLSERLHQPARLLLAAATVQERTCGSWKFGNGLE